MLQKLFARLPVAVLIAAACTEFSVEAVDIARVVVSPNSAMLRVGETMTLAAAPQDQAGNPLTDRAVAWSSSDESIATVDASGRVTGVTVGTARITASSGGRQGSADVQVGSSDVAAVEILPRTPVVLVGGNTQLNVQVRDELGQPLSPPVQWSSSNPPVLTVSNGLVSGLVIGSARVRATAGGVTDSVVVVVAQLPPASIIVSPPSALLAEGDTLRFTASVTGANGLPDVGAVVEWRTDDASVAQVDAAGLVTARAAGRTVIRAASGNRTASADVEVRRTTPTTVTVTPAVAGLPIGGTVQLAATARDEQGAILTGRVATWSSANPQIASVNATGLVTGLASGSTEITATIDGVSDSSFIAVTPAQVAAVRVTPTTGQLPPGDTLRFLAEALDAAGNVLAGRTATWRTSDAAVATVNGSGLVTAVAGGAVTITATISGVDGTAALTVTTPTQPVASVTVTPASTTLPVGNTAQLTATTRASDGTVLTGRTVTWSTSDPAVATVDGTGRVMAAGAGSATITATSEGQSGTAAVTVTPPPPQPVATVTVSPSTASIQVGSTVQLSATTRASDGSVLTGRTVTWSTSNPAVATVDGTGLVMAAGAGSATITATSDGQSGTATVTVTSNSTTPFRIDIQPANPTVRRGQRIDLSATVRAADGTALTGYAITWDSSDSGTANVNGNGRVMAKRVGVVTITASAAGLTGTTTVTIVP